jgi:hypothetical protein
MIVPVIPVIYWKIKIQPGVLSNYYGNYLYSGFINNNKQDKIE